MGYDNRLIDVECGKCKSLVGWSLSPSKKAPASWECRKCRVRNNPGTLPQWPNVPRTLYIGWEKHRQMKLYPVPPESEDESWAQPFSIRSFVAQASDHLGGCGYSTSRRGSVMGEPVFSDMCRESDVQGWQDEGEPCHMVAGFTVGQPSCRLWERVEQLCQTEMERRFLHWYLGLAKDRQFPMLIPQARIGIAERRRPDFVLFVPLHQLKYKWYGVQRDAAHPPEFDERDEMRDAEISVHGYEVISLRPEKHGYHEEVKTLVERVEREMGAADVDMWKYTVRVPVISFTEPDDEILF